MNIALISPNKNAYSETFIQAHKKFLKGNVFYFYGDFFPCFLEGYGRLQVSRFHRIIHLLKGKYNLNKFSATQLAFLDSLKKNKIEVVFAEYGPTSHEILPFCKILGLPLIVHFHGYDASKKDIKYSYYTRVFKYASFIVVVSKKMYADLLSWGCPENKLIYNPYGPDKSFLEVEASFSKPQFISLGRFVDKKAPYYIVLAFKKVLKQYPEATLIMGGEGELWNACKNLVKYYGIEGSVSFPGIISPEGFRKYLKATLQ